MEIITNQISIQISKTKMLEIISEALADETASASIKRVLNPFIANSFPAFPEYSNVALGETADDGSTTVSLKIPPKAKVVVPEFEAGEESILGENAKVVEDLIFGDEEEDTV